MQIRQATSDDFHAVLRLLEGLWPDLDLCAAETEKVFAAYTITEADVPLVATEDGRIVGFASFNVRNSLWRSGRIACLDTLVVDEERKREGIGAALVERVEDLASELGCSYVELDSGFHRSAAHEFYEAQGFVRFGIMFGKQLEE